MFTPGIPLSLHLEVDWQGGGGCWASGVQQGLGSLWFVELPYPKVNKQTAPGGEHLMTLCPLIDLGEKVEDAYYSCLQMI